MAGSAGWESLKESSGLCVVVSVASVASVVRVARVALGSTLH